MRKIVFGYVVTVMVICGYSIAYTPPLAIPSPNFGMDESLTSYIGKSYNFTLDGRGVTTYPISSISNLPYTHFIDNTHPSATDVGNPYGTEALPRMTLPFIMDAYPQVQASWMAPGSVWEIHGGEYVIPPASYTQGAVSIYANGNSASPCYIRGGSTTRPALGGFTVSFVGRYLIIENLLFSNTEVDMKWSSQLSESIDYTCIRDNEFFGDGYSNDGRMALEFYGTITNSCTQNTVYNNHIHHYGPAATTTSDLDNCGIYIWGYSSYIWVLSNTIHHNGGDSVQAGNNAVRNTHHIYIGDNTFYYDRENAVDIKECEDVIISQNTMYGYTEQGRMDDGMIAGTHQGSIAGGDYPHRIWWLFNVMHTGTYYAHNGAGAVDCYLIGNVIYNVSDTVGNYGRAIHMGQMAATETYYIYNNTIESCETGVHQNTGTSSATIIVANNIISNMIQGQDQINERHIWDEMSTITFDYNLFYQPGATATIIRLGGGGGTDYTLAEYQSATGQALNCVEGNPLFTSSATYDFTLQAGSPGIEAGTNTGDVITAYDTFQSLYGINIKKDIDEMTRSGVWDVGAHESGATSDSVVYLLALMVELNQ